LRSCMRNLSHSPSRCVFNIFLLCLSFAVFLILRVRRVGGLTDGAVASALRRGAGGRAAAVGGGPLAEPPAPGHRPQPRPPGTGPRGGTEGGRGSTVVPGATPGRSFEHSTNHGKAGGGWGRFWAPTPRPLSGVPIPPAHGGGEIIEGCHGREARGNRRDPDPHPLPSPSQSGRGAASLSPPEGVGYPPPTPICCGTGLIPLHSRPPHVSPSKTKH